MAEEIFWSIETVRGFVTVEVVLESEFQRSAHDLQWKKDKGRLTGRLTCFRVQFGLLQVQQFPDAFAEVCFEGKRDSHARGRPMDLLEHLLQLCRKGLFNLLVDLRRLVHNVVGEMGSSSFCSLLEIGKFGSEVVKTAVCIEGSGVRLSKIREALRTVQGRSESSS